MGKELRKQLIDQPAHFLWGMGAGGSILIGALFLSFPLGSFPIAAGVGSCWFWTRRERLQFRDGAHEIDFPIDDPTLDNLMYWVGLFAGCELTYFLRGIY